MATGAPFPACKSWKRFHAPGSVGGWILVEADDASACYEHAAEWAECLDWEVTPVLSDEEAGPLIAKVYALFFAGAPPTRSPHLNTPRY